MTKQDFLYGKEFKTSDDSWFIYKYKHGVIQRENSVDTWHFEAIIEEITDDSITVMNTVLGGFLKVKKNFSNLIIA